MRIAFLFCLFILAQGLSAQEPLKSQLAPCGTRGGSDWLIQYREHPGLTDRSGDTLWVALQPHLLAKDAGNGRMSNEKFLNAFCRLNADFAQANIQFYIKHDWDLLNETDWYMHSDIPKGIEMMLTNNVPDALNTYFVADPAGNCGYNLPYGGVAIAHSCANADDHTWAHEVGHALSLPHPFIGWEGKTYNYATPTPVKLTYDYTYFHDTLDTPPVPLDTALVENWSGDNCLYAADLICDSRPDYLSYRWDCDAQNKSTVKQRDPQGVDFYSDGTLFMSYASDNCQNRFTPDQIIIMRATLQTEKAAWLAPGPIQQPVTALPEALEPVMDETAPIDGALFRWTPVPNATHYLVQASRLLNFSYKQVDTIVTDTFLHAGHLTPNIKYYWRVRPFNYSFACSDFNTLATFKTAATSETQTADEEGWRYYPSQLGGGRLTLEFPASWIGENTQCRISDATGRIVWKQTFEAGTDRVRCNIQDMHWPFGVYFLQAECRKGQKNGILLR